VSVEPNQPRVRLQPGRPRRPNKRGIARRNTLILHAVRLIADRGIDHVRVVDVCQAAGVPHSAFYWYFRDLDSLVAQAIVDGRRLIRLSVAETIAGIDDPLARIYVTTRESFRLGIENEVLRVFTLGDVEASISADYAEEIRKSIEVFIHDGVIMLSEGQVRGVVRDDKAVHHLAHCLRSLVNHNVVSYQRGFLHGDCEVLADTVASCGVRSVCADMGQAIEVERAWSGRQAL
jgi:AcrR family transcriptional regulator